MGSPSQLLLCRVTAQGARPPSQKGRRPDAQTERLQSLCLIDVFPTLSARRRWCLGARGLPGALPGALTPLGPRVAGAARPPSLALQDGTISPVSRGFPLPPISWRGQLTRAGPSVLPRPAGTPQGQPLTFFWSPRTKPGMTNGQTREVSSGASLPGMIPLRTDTGCQRDPWVKAEDTDRNWPRHARPLVVCTGIVFHQGLCRRGAAWGTGVVGG